MQDQFKYQFPKAFFLDIENIPELEIYLKNHDWLEGFDGISYLEKAGEGNMNLTLRAKSKDKTFIVKQARPWVEKYPQVEAPVERAIVEGKFYQTISASQKLQNLSPKIIGMDNQSFILVMEDLGESSDFTDIYQKEQNLKIESLKILMEFLNELHGNFTTDKTGKKVENLAMRKLNHEHIFNYPFLEENGFNLDDIHEGLQALSMLYKTDEHLKESIVSLGRKYLETGDYLLHGDFYPGSWLNTDNGVKVIDPEFCFSGYREFELGILLAHLKMAEQSSELQNKVVELYEYSAELNSHLLSQFTGIEIMRRIIGLAQLPLELNLQEKKELLQEAHHLLTEPNIQKFCNA